MITINERENGWAVYVKYNGKSYVFTELEKLVLFVLDYYARRKVAHDNFLSEPE